MNYMLLSLFCINGWYDRVKEMFDKAEKAGELVDILDDDAMLFQIGVFRPFVEEKTGEAEKPYADIIRLLVKYYEDHYIKGEKGSDEYLHSKAALTEIVRKVTSFGTEATPLVLEAFGEYYIPEDEDDSSVCSSDFVADAIDEDGGSTALGGEHHTDSTEHPETRSLAGDTSDSS